MNNDKEVIKKVLKYIGKYKIQAIFSLILAAVIVASTLYVPILTGNAIDLMVYGNVDWNGVIKILFMIGAMVVLTMMAQWIMNVINTKMTYNVVRDIRQKAIRKIEQVPLSYMDVHSQGDMVSRVVADVDQFADGLLMGFTQLFTGVMTILGTLLFMLSINVYITIVVVIVTPLSLFVAAFISKHTYSMFMEQSKTRGEQTAFIDEMIGNLKVVKAYTHEDEAMEQFDEINNRLQKCSLRAVFFSSLTNPSTRFVNGLVYALVGISGAFLACKNHITVGELSCFLSYANQYTKPFNEISGVVTELQNALACAERIFELIEAQPQKPDDEDAAVLKNVEGMLNLMMCVFHMFQTKS